MLQLQKFTTYKEGVVYRNIANKINEYIEETFEEY